MTFEICAESFDAALLAKQYKVKRIELCSALGVGGLTPSYGLIKACAALEGAEVHAMIRHKEGGFVYTWEDIEIMLNDILGVKAAGGHGVVFGCLDANNEIDVEQNKVLIETAKKLDLEVTFHRAFDFVTDHKNALEQLIEMGFDRLLTSGKAAKAIEGMSVLAELVVQSKGRIEIMAGSGVSTENAEILKKTGVDALHFTVHTKMDDDISLGMGQRSLMDEEKLKGIVGVV